MSNVKMIATVSAALVLAASTVRDNIATLQAVATDPVRLTDAVDSMIAAVRLSHTFSAADIEEAFLADLRRFAARAAGADIGRTMNAPDPKSVPVAVSAALQAIRSGESLTAAFFQFAEVGIAATETNGQLALIVKLVCEEYVPSKKDGEPGMWKPKTTYAQVVPAMLAADGEGTVFLTDGKAYRAAKDAGLWRSKRDAAEKSLRTHGWDALNKSKRKVLMALGYDAQGNPPAVTFRTAAD